MRNAVSRYVQSAIIVLVRSARSFLPKNDRGIFLNFSASVILLVPVSTYVARKVELYCQYVTAKSEQVL